MDYFTKTGKLFITFQFCIINVGDEVTLLNAVGGYGILTMTKIINIAYFQS